MRKHHPVPAFTNCMYRSPTGAIINCFLGSCSGVDISLPDPKSFRGGNQNEDKRPSRQYCIILICRQFYIIPFIRCIRWIGIAFSSHNVLCHWLVLILCRWGGINFSSQIWNVCSILYKNYVEERSSIKESEHLTCTRFSSV